MPTFNSYSIRFENIGIYYPHAVADNVIRQILKYFDRNTFHVTHIILLEFKVMQNTLLIIGLLKECQYVFEC